MKRADMVEDGQVKGLLVHPDWWEPYHPLLVPPPLRADGLPKYRPSPDGVPAPTAPALLGVLTGSMSLTWSAGTSSGSTIDYYYLYRSDNGAAYTLLANIPVVVSQTVTNDGFIQTSTYAQPYVDNTLVGGHTYTWVVLAHAIEGGFSVASNVVTTAVPSAPVLSLAGTKLSWTDATPAGQILSYQIYRSLNNGAYSLLTTVVGSQSTYTDGTTGSGLYSYYMTATGTNSLVSGNSNIVSFDNTFALVTLLMHGDGLNHGAIFIDSSSYAHTFENGFGGIETSTTVPSFGSASLFAKSSGNLALLGPNDLNPASSELQIDGGQDWTVESRIFVGSVHPDGVNPCFIMFPSGVSSGPFALKGQIVDGSGIHFQSSGTNQASSSYIINQPGFATLDAWHHVAVVCFNHTYTLYVDGISVASQFLAGNLRTITGDPAITRWKIEMLGSFALSSFSTNTYMEEIRITNGLARYTANFTPPTGPFPNS